MQTALRVLAAIGLALLAVAAGLLGIYFWRGDHPRFLALEERAAHAHLIEKGVRLITPTGEGPFPTVLLIHGCGGLRGDNEPNLIMEEYAATAVQAGWAAAIVDSYGPRGWEASFARKRVCGGTLLPGLERASDILAAMDTLARDPRVTPGRLRIAAWSHGGWALGDLLTLRDPGDGSFRRSMMGVEGVMLTYPYCGFPARAGRKDWTWVGSVRLVFADRDTVQPASGCRAMIERAVRAGSHVETQTFAGATHAFDERLQTPNSPFRYDAASARAAREGFRRWLSPGARSP